MADYSDDDDDGDRGSHEYAGFLSGGDPAGHNEFRFSGFSSAPVNSPHPEDYDAPQGPLGGLRIGRRLGGLGQRWGLGGGGGGGGLGGGGGPHAGPSNAPPSEYGNQIVHGDRGHGMNNFDMIVRGDGALMKRISNLNLGERLWGPSLDLNQLIMREDWGLAAMQCKMRPHLAGKVSICNCLGIC